MSRTTTWALNSIGGSRRCLFGWSFYANVLLIVFLSIVVRLLFLCIYRGDLTSDYLAYWNMALEIYNGNGIREITYSTGYPMLLLSFLFIFGPHLLVVYSINILLSAATTLLIIAIAYEIFGSQPAAALSGIIWAVYAESVVYTTYVAKENLTIPLILLIIYFATLIANGKCLTTAAVLGGISTGLVAIAGTSGVCMVFSVLWAILRIEQKIQKKMLLATLVVMTATAVVLPWVYRNYDVYGHFVINSNGGINLYVGNNPHADGFYVSMYDSVGKASWDQLRTSLNDYELDKYFGARAIAYIRDNPFSTATLFFKKIGLFWTPPYHQGTEGTGTGVGEMVLRKIWLVEWCLMVAGALYALKMWGIRGNRGIEAVVLGILVYTALHGVFFVIFRYRLPAMALVAVIAGGVYRYRLADEAGGPKPEARAYPAAAGNRN